MPVNTHWDSWVATIATTPGTPTPLGPLQMRTDMVGLAVVPPAAVGFFRCRIGMPWAAANVFTSRRKRLPFFSVNAGDGMGSPP